MAKKTGSRKHVHKYFQNPENGVWTCGDPDCTHFLPLNVPAPLGKRSICWGCGDQFILIEDNMSEHQPHCPKCSGTDTTGLSNFLSELGIK